MTSWCGQWWSHTWWRPFHSPPRTSYWIGCSLQPWLLLCTLQDSASASNHHQQLKWHTQTMLHFHVCVLLDDHPLDLPICEDKHHVHSNVDVTQLICQEMTHVCHSWATQVYLVVTSPTWLTTLQFALCGSRTYQTTFIWSCVYKRKVKCYLSHKRWHRRHYKDSEMSKWVNE